MQQTISRLEYFAGGFCVFRGAIDLVLGRPPVRRVARVNGSANVPRHGLRPCLLLYFATPSTLATRQLLLWFAGQETAEQPKTRTENSRHLAARRICNIAPTNASYRSGGWGALRSEIKEEAEGRGTFAEQSAPTA